MVHLLGAQELILSIKSLYFPPSFLSAEHQRPHTLLWRGKVQSAGSRPLARVTPGAGVLAGGFAAGSDRVYFQRVLSDAWPLIRALDCGWHSAFLCSASLSALSQRSGCLGRKCSRVDQISVFLDFVPRWQRTHRVLQGTSGRQPAGGE